MVSLSAMPDTLLAHTEDSATGWVNVGFDDLLETLMLTQARVTDAVDRRLREGFDLPHTLYRPLPVIDRTAGCRIHDVSVALEMTTGGVSKIIDRIEARGLCSRRSNPGDLRSSLIELTPEGTSLLTLATPVVQAEVRRFFEARSAPDISALAAVFDLDRRSA